MADPKPRKTQGNPKNPLGYQTIKESKQNLSKSLYAKVFQKKNPLGYLGFSKTKNKN